MLFGGVALEFKFKENLLRHLFLAPLLVFLTRFTSR
jgi:hypothetical protein